MFHQNLLNMITRFNPCNIAEVQLTYSSNVKPSDRPKISTSKEAYKILLENWDSSTIELREEMKLVLLNNSNRVLGIYLVSQGGITGTIADPKLMFSVALKANATSIILCHNHPSGNLKPSNADIKVTDKCKRAGEFLEIRLLDHMIISREGYYSFADEGLI